MKERLTIHPKVTGATLGGSLTVIVTWMLGLKGVEVPGDVAASFTVLFAFAGGWLAPR